MKSTKSSESHSRRSTDQLIASSHEETSKTGPHNTNYSDLFLCFFPSCIATLYLRVPWPAKSQFNPSWRKTHWLPKLDRFQSSICKLILRVYRNLKNKNKVKNLKKPRKNASSVKPMCSLHSTLNRPLLLKMPSVRGVSTTRVSLNHAQKRGH